MAVKVVMPKWGLKMQEATITRWLKKEGETVQKDEPLLEVETEKITSEVAAPSSGILARVVAAEGEEVRVGDTIAIIAEDPDEEIPGPETDAPTNLEPMPKDEVTPVAAEAGPPIPASPAAGHRTECDRPVASSILAAPAARRLAREHGIELAAVTGTGRGGRISEEDVRVFIEAAEGPRRIPMRGMRVTIARRMQTSLQQSAQVTLVSEADVTELSAQHESLKEKFSATYTDLILKAAALALREHPHLNATATQDEILIHREIHIGLAVALEDGLQVPVVRDADRKSLQEIALTARAAVAKAKAGRLTAEDVEGGTFTVTNLGGYEVDAFTPIINPPQVAILGVGRIVEKPVKRNKELAWRQMMTLSLTFDHRVIDGAPAAAFLKTVKDHLENLERLL